MNIHLNQLTFTYTNYVMHLWSYIL